MVCRKAREDKDRKKIRYLFAERSGWVNIKTSQVNISPTTMEENKISVIMKTPSSRTISLYYYSLLQINWQGKTHLRFENRRLRQKRQNNDFLFYNKVVKKKGRPERQE